MIRSRTTGGKCIDVIVNTTGAETGDFGVIDFAKPGSPVIWRSSG